MANLYVREYVSPRNDNAVLPAPTEPAQADQKVAFTTSTASAAFGVKTKYVRLIADADCHIQFGESPTATTSSALMKANTVEYFCVHPGYKVAAVTAS